MAIMAPLSLLFLMLSYQLHLNTIVALLANPSDHDFSYMKSVSNATDLPPQEEYDYIVVGGGTAGCPLAATLSEKYSVLVLERGSVPKAHPNVLSGSGFFANIMEDDEDNIDADSPAQRFTSEDGVANVRGRVLGGSSMINAGFYSRANSEYYSSNEEVKWDMELVEQAYDWVEDSIVSHHKSLAAWQSAVKDGLLEAGVSPDNDFSLDHKIGTKISGSTFDDLGNRHGAVELLNKGNLGNLKIVVHATAERVIFSTESSKRIRAIGVIYTDRKGKSHKALIRNKGEIILSAGAIGSPQLLLLSGIGPDSDLSSLGIPSVHSQPNVGEFMADNPRNNIHLVIPFPSLPSPAQVVGITEDYFIETVSYSLAFSPTPAPFSLFSGPTSKDFSLASIVEKPPGPLSHGTLKLDSSTEVKTTPRVKFNYFSHPKDLERCVAGMRKVGEMLETKPLETFKYKDLNGKRSFMFFGSSLPANYQSDDEAMEDFCRSSVTSFWHYHGGCLVGKVVDGDFRVSGVKSLRVVDGSTFNISPGTNPQATLMMLGRYMGIQILRGRNKT